jgi:hypothetical protein
MAVKKVEYEHNYTISIIRNALARYITACSLSHKWVTSKELRTLVLTVHSKADPIL